MGKKLGSKTESELAYVVLEIDLLTGVAEEVGSAETGEEAQDQVERLIRTQNAGPIVTYGYMYRSEF